MTRKLVFSLVDGGGVASGGMSGQPSPTPTCKCITYYCHNQVWRDTSTNYVVSCSTNTVGGGSIACLSLWFREVDNKQDLASY